MRPLCITRWLLALYPPPPPLALALPSLSTGTCLTVVFLTFRVPAQGGGGVCKTFLYIFLAQ